MRNAALKLHVHVAPNANDVYFLTGKKYWELTAFCMYSLAQVSTIPLRPVFVDDGTFNDELTTLVKMQFPGCVIKTAAETATIIGTILPQSKYPCINKKLAVYPHIKKLTHIHAGSSGWKMVLDSDMLFFKNPAELNNWLKNPTHPFFLQDPVSSYHYTLRLMEQLTGNKIIEKLNVGAVGLKSEDINWDELEHWIRVLEETEGTSYLLEQALSAMLASGRKTIVANADDYIVMPGKYEATHPSATLHHYVDKSKEWYYKAAWKRIK